MTPEIVTGDVAALADRAASELATEAARALAARGAFTLALAGGSIARAFFPRLAAVPLDWTRVDVFWADERDVPPADAASNYGLAHRHWLTPAGVPASRVHRMFAAPPGADVVTAYTRELVRSAGAPPSLDLVLLGVGEDGHVASLFPDHPALEATRPVVLVEDAPKPPPRRMTLTLPVLARSRRVVIAALGAAKAEAVHDALRSRRSTSPAARLTRATARPLWLIEGTPMT
jgi:6-phosphogluconolactonase